MLAQTHRGELHESRHVKPHPARMPEFISSPLGPMQRCAHGRINAQTMLVITTPTPNQEQEFADTYGVSSTSYILENCILRINQSRAL